MKIAALSQMMQQSSSPNKTDTKTSGLNFSEVLAHNQEKSQVQSSDQKEIPTESLSFQEMIDELRIFLEEFSFDAIGINNNAQQESRIDNSDSTTTSLVEYEIASIQSESNSLEELIDLVNSSPTIIAVLSLVKVVEGLSTNTTIDFESFLTKLNQLLKNEYPSYNNTKSIHSSIVTAIDEMGLDDKMLIEGQIALDKWSGKDDFNRLTKIDMLLSISNQLTEAVEFGKSESQVKSEILSKMTDLALNKQIENSLQSLFKKADLATLATLFNKKVDKLFGEKISTDIITSTSKIGNLPTIETSIIASNSNKFSGGQMSDFLLSQTQNQVGNNNLDVEEEFTIQLEKHISKQSNISLDTQKTESSSSTRQEFTNQLLNAFKTSRFGQMPNGANRLVLKLNPEHLGTLTVRLVQKNGEMIAKIIASTGSAKDLLDHSITQLRQALPSVQIEVERFEVFTEQPAKTFKESPEQNEKNEQESSESKPEDEQDNEKSFIESLKEILNTTV